jgi:hypothetical protein
MIITANILIPFSLPVVVVRRGQNTYLAIRRKFSGTLPEKSVKCLNFFFFVANDTFLELPSL